MRTTLTLDDDLARRLHALARETGRPFKDVVNERIRLGLTRADPDAAEPFAIVPRAMGPRDGVNFDSFSALLDQLDGPPHR